MSFINLLDIVLLIAMGAFAMYSWFIAMLGSTTIEFFRSEGLGRDRREATLRFPTISDNLYRIFGTHKFFRIFSPSFRNVPFTGLEWSFKFKDEGYDCDGMLVSLVDQEAKERLAAVSQFDDEVEMVDINSTTGIGPPGGANDTADLMSQQTASQHSLAS